MDRVIKRRNPKAQDITVSHDGQVYGNEVLNVNFQKGEIATHGVRNGAFVEELLMIVVDRLRHDSRDDAIAGQLETILDELAPVLEEEEI